MVKVYGTMQCPDCVDCKRDFDAAGILFEFINIEELLGLKQFLLLRDKNLAFVTAREKGYIGIPCVVKEDGHVTLDYTELLP